MAVKEKVNKHPEWKTTLKERLSYAVGFNGSVGESMLLQTYLTTYLLMTGLDVGITGTILLVMKVIDAIDDMLFGWIIDRIHPEKNEFLQKFVGKGRFLPWLRLCFYIMPVAVIMLYHIPAGASTVTKLVWFCVFYLIADLSYTLLDVPMNAMLTTMTDDGHERDNIIMIRGIAMLVVVGATYLGLTLLTSAEVGMSIGTTVTIFSVVMIICMLPMVFNVKEHSVMVESEEKNNDMSIVEALKCVITNRNLLSYYGGYIVSGCLATGAAVSLFASYYLFGSSLFSLVMTAPTLIMSYIMMIIIPKMAEKHDKNRIRMISLTISLVTGPIVYFVGYKSIPLYLLTTFINLIPAGIAAGVGNFLIPSCIEYGKFTSGKDATGISFAFGTFATKFPGAIASSLALWLLGVFGWQTIEAESFAEIAALNITQPESAINGLWALTAGVPLIGNALAYICYLFYNLNDKDADIMAKCNAGEISREEATAMLSKKY